MFAEKGFHRATVKEIARVAGIADGTIYTYFASKTEVLLGILHRLNESTEREQQLTPEREQDLRSFFTTYLRQRMALLWSNAEVFQAVLPEMLVNEDSPSPNAPSRHRAQQGKYGASMWLSRFVPSRACFWVC